MVSLVHLLRVASRVFSVRAAYLAIGLWAEGVACTQAAAPVLFTENGHYYQYVAASMAWQEAKQAAERQTYLGTTGHLATVTSEREQVFVYEHVFRPHVPTASRNQAAWLGGYQSPRVTEPAAGWHWVSGEAWCYVHWGEGEPNDWTGPEDKLVLWGTGEWNDFFGDRYGPGIGPTGYIAEFDVPKGR